MTVGKSVWFVDGKIVGYGLEGKRVRDQILAQRAQEAQQEDHDFSYQKRVPLSSKAPYDFSQ
jgi:hypothetical protein